MKNTTEHSFETYIGMRKEKKEKIVMLRLTPSEHEKLKILATTHGESISSFLRAVALAGIQYSAINN